MEYHSEVSIAKDLSDHVPEEREGEGANGVKEGRKTTEIQSRLSCPLRLSSAVLELLSAKVGNEQRLGERNNARIIFRH